MNVYREFGIKYIDTDLSEHTICYWQFQALKLLSQDCKAAIW